MTGSACRPEARGTARGAVGRSPGRLLFDAILLLFVGSLVVASFELSSRARLVPLVIGLPTLAMIALVTLVDLFPGLTPRRRGAKLADVTHRADAQLRPEQGAEMAKAGWRSVVSRAAVTGMDADAPAPLEREVLIRQALFAAWVVGLYVVSALVSVIVAVAAGLFLLLRFVNRERWMLSVGITAGTTLALYALFAIALRVRL